MNAHRLLSIVAGVVIATSVLIGCAGTESSRSEAGATVRTFRGETHMYRVQITQHEREGQCVRRDILFLSHSKLYIHPYLDRVQAVDFECDATFVSDFERFAIMRSPEQQDRYANSFSFRSRVDEDLWGAYQQVLFDDEIDRRRGRASASERKDEN